MTKALHAIYDPYEWWICTRGSLVCCTSYKRFSRVTAESICAKSCALSQSPARLDNFQARVRVFTKCTLAPCLTWMICICVVEAAEEFILVNWPKWESNYDWRGSYNIWWASSMLNMQRNIMLRRWRWQSPIVLVAFGSLLILIIPEISATEVQDCSESQFGCCSSNDTFPAHGPNDLGCCLNFEFGCCPDHLTLAQGPYGEGCSCKDTEFGCCPDDMTPASGPDNQGCG